MTEEKQTEMWDFEQEVHDMINFCISMRNKIEKMETELKRTWEEIHNGK